MARSRFTSRTDFLGGQAARPNATVPDVCLLDVPHPDAGIQVRRYRSISIPPAAAPPTMESILQRLRNDPLEIGWRALNGIGIADTSKGTKTLLDNPCCVIAGTDPGEMTGDDDLDPLSTSSPKDERLLWCFQLGGQEGRLMEECFTGLQGLEELLPRLSPIMLSQLNRCKKHGRTATCLERKSGDQSRPREGVCRVNFEPSTGLSYAWECFTEAVSEKLAWREWKRFSGRSKASFSFDTSPILPIASYSPNRLLLQMPQQERPRCEPSSSSSSSLEVRPLMLLPLNVPALLLGPQNITAPQESHLVASFETAIGPTWENGRSESRLAARIAGRPYSDWSTYWVPLLSAEALSVGLLSKTVADQVVRDWQRYQGVITIWPTHLVHQISASAPVSKITPGQVCISQDRVSNNDLLNDAAGLFEFLNSYQEPIVIDEPDVPDSAFEDSPDDNEGMKTDTPTNQVESDPGDLFHSDPLRDHEDGDSLFGDSGPPSRSSDSILGDEGDASKIDEYTDTTTRWNQVGDDMLGQDDNNEEAALRITEDDFDFFNSPSQPSHVDVSVDVMPNEGKLSPGRISAEESEGTAIILDVEPEPVTGKVATPIEETNRDRIEAMTPPTEPDDEQTAPESVEETAHFSHPTSFQSGMDIIPSPFEPIVLPQGSSSLASFAYCMPSPAPTPDALRPELFERLKPKTTTYDYAATWENHSDDSTSDEMEDDYTGAPPTPESESDYSYSPSKTGSPARTDSKKVDWEVRFGGTTVVGSEWAVLKDDPDLAGGLRRHWNTSWSIPIDDSEIPKSVSAQVSTKDSRWKKINVDKLAEEIVWNHQLRASLRTVSQSASTAFSEAPAAWPARLSELASTASLVTPAIYLGYGGKIMQVSMSATRYWRELGVEPAGGKKNLTAYMLCEKSDYPAAEDLSQRILKGYEDCRLGKYLLGTAFGAKNGIVIAKASEWSKQISAFAEKSDGLTVIYLLFPRSQTMDAALLKSMLAESTNKSLVTHIIPSSSLSSDDTIKIAFEIYARVATPVPSISLRGRPLNDQPSWTVSPCFTLAPETTPRPALTLQWPLKSFDVMNRQRLVYGTYGCDVDLGLMVACVVDSQGFNLETKVWSIEGELTKTSMRLPTVLEFFLKTAREISGDWRLCIVSYGLMAADEIDCWRNIIEGRAETHIVLMVDANASTPNQTFHLPRQVMSNVNAATLNDPQTIIIDETLVGYGGVFNHRMPIRISSTTTSPTAFPSPSTSFHSKSIITYPESSFLISIASPTTQHHFSSIFHIMTRQIAVPPWKSKDKEEAENIEEVIMKDLYRLTCLARRRHGFEDSALPVQIEAVRVVLECMRGLAQKEDEAK